MVVLRGDLTLEPGLSFTIQNMAPFFVNLLRKNVPGGCASQAACLRAAFCDAVLLTHSFTGIAKMAPAESSERARRPAVPSKSPN